MDAIEAEREKGLPRLFILCLVLVLWDPWALATSTGAMPWQSWIVRSDFVGIVECQKRDDHIAEFLVVESWKSESHDESLSVYIEWFDREKYRSIPEVGHRYIIAAFELTEKGRLRLFSHPHPSDADSLARVNFFIKQYCDIPEVPNANGRDFTAFGQRFRDYDHMVQSTKTLLRYARNDPEFALIDTLAVEEFDTLWTRPMTQRQLSQKWVSNLPQESLVEAALVRLLIIHNLDTVRFGRRVSRILRQGGMGTTISFLKNPNTHKTPFRPLIVDILRHIESNPYSMPTLIIRESRARAPSRGQQIMQSTAFGILATIGK